MTQRESPGRPPGLVWIALAVAACSPNDGLVDSTPEPTELTYLGEHVRMGVADDATLCGRSFEYTDRFVGRYLEQSSNGPPTDKLEFHVLSPEALEDPYLCGPNLESCAREGVVYASSGVHLHEAVHAVRRLQPEPGWGIGVLEEGIAQLHFTIGLGWDDSLRPSELDQYLDGARPSKLYDPAAQLLGIVTQEFGFEKAEELVDASAEAESASELDDIVLDVLGVDWPTLDDLYMATPRCSPTERARQLVACSADPLPWDASAQEPIISVTSDRFDCDNPEVIGPLFGSLWQEHTIDIPVDGAYTLSVDVATAQVLRLTDCDRGCEGSIDVDWDNAVRTEALELRAGRYVMHLGRSLGDDNPVGFQLSGPS